MFYDCRICVGRTETTGTTQTPTVIRSIRVVSKRGIVLNLAVTLRLVRPLWQSTIHLKCWEVPWTTWRSFPMIFMNHPGKSNSCISWIMNVCVDWLLVGSYFLSFNSCLINLLSVGASLCETSLTTSGLAKHDITVPTQHDCLGVAKHCSNLEAPRALNIHKERVWRLHKSLKLVGLQFVFRRRVQ